MFSRLILHLVLMMLSASALAFPIYPAAPDGFPQGNYYEKCAECRLEGDKLICHCPAPDKKIYKRTLDMSVCIKPIVGLKRGVLFCEEDANIRDGAEVPPKLPPPVQIDYEGELPEGDYQEYCDQCDIVDGSLVCSCKIDGWFWDSIHEVTLPLGSCKDLSEVTYLGGLLFCSFKEFMSFSKLSSTCKYCTLEGSTLDCIRCEKTRCGWNSTDFKKKVNIVRARFSEMRTCTRPIINCNGNIRCGECDFLDLADQFQWNRPVYGTHSKFGYCYKDSPY